MALADDLQARIVTVRARLDNIRPNIAPNLAARASAMGGGPLGGNILGRARAIAQGRPILGQAMSGTLITGGVPNAASAQVAISQSGYRSLPPPTTPVTVLGGGYRLS